MQQENGQAPKPWRNRPYHRLWLTGQARTLFDTFQFASVNPLGGFYELDDDGQPIKDENGSGTRNLHATSRLIFSFCVAKALGHPGADEVIDHGMDYLWSGHRDPENGGYFWGVGDDGPVDPSKQAYGHAFVLLAAASAKRVGHPDADRLLADIVPLLKERFWEERHGAVAEEFTANWQPLGAPYRGQNSNMHLTEALMAGYEATGDETLLRMAESIADLLIRRITGANDWRLPEHFNENWELDLAYKGSEMFRPAGSTPGHWLEWSRLLAQLWVAGSRRHDWMMEAASTLFHNAVRDGWDPEYGGFFYTVGFDGRPLNTEKMWWPACEGIGAAAFLHDLTGDAFFEDWYQRIWNFTTAHVLERPNGRWIPQIDRELEVNTSLFSGQPDIYHSLQACLIPLFPAKGSLLDCALAEANAG
ncbi:AGE family epimerase/isomerase [Faunimonas pinastri]|uniref:AGE family epimerase/isomerase n=1 Tax=Faunimonas pinastri TaxID=1855383 RepID=UPI001EEBBEE1|nr:AGE family epimerase/isomerase [Faunimonas pinastri]